MRITADKTLCIGSGQCVLAAPGLFDQDEADGVVVPLADLVPAGLEPAVREAVALCPSRAIGLVADGR